MHNYIILDNKEIVLIDFNEYFKDNICIKIVNNLHDHLILGKFNKDTKRIMCHNIIHELCNLILSIKSKHKKIILTKDNIVSQLSNWYDDDIIKEVNNHIYKCLDNINKNLPIPMLIVKNVSINELDDTNFWLSGSGKELDAMIYSIKSKDYSKLNFKNIKQYTKKLGLNFLNEQYFTSLKTKQLLYN